MGWLGQPFWHHRPSFWHLGAPWGIVKGGGPELDFINFGTLLSLHFECCLGTEDSISGFSGDFCTDVEWKSGRRGRFYVLFNTSGQLF